MTKKTLIEINMENKSTYILLLIFAALCCLSTVNAEDVGDNSNLFSLDETNVEEVSNDGLEDPANKHSQQASLNDLQTDIDNANEVFNITKDYTYQKGDTGVNVNKKIIINGNNHIIDAQNHCRIFTISSPQVTINNLTFKNAYSGGDGGAIYAFCSDITVNNSKFINNYAKNGGAIYASNNAVRFNIINSKFINNAAQYGKGGALYCSAYNSQVTDCLFDSNFAQNGGSVYWGESKKGWDNKQIMYGNDGRIINSTFLENTAVNGGAVFWFANTGKIINSTFKRNTGYNSDNGGAIYWKGEKGIVNNTLFICNTAESRAGAIYWEGSHGTVTDSTFTNNTAQCIGSQFRGGGAIMWKGKWGLITNSNFTGNTAVTDGGAIHWYETNSAKGMISNCSFNYNTAAKGSAIFVHYGDLDIEDTSFFNNRAQSDEIICKLKDNTLTVTFAGCNNMVNAIHNYKISQYNNVTLKNCQYNALSTQITDHESNIKVNIEIYNSKNELIRNVSALTDKNGMATGSIKELMPENYTVRAIHYADDYYTQISKTGTSFEIKRLATQINARHFWDKALTHDNISVNVVDENGESVRNGLCMLAFENMTYVSEVKDGIAVFEDVEMPFPGNYYESVRYLGNEYYSPSNGDIEVTVLKIDTYTNDHDITYLSQHEVLIEVTVTDEFGHPVLSGEVELDVFYENDNGILKNTLKGDMEIYTSEIDNGKAIFDIKLSHNGYYLLDAEYHGDKLYNPSEDIAEILTSTLNTTVKCEDITAKAGESRQITCEVIDNEGNPVKNGTAILKINNQEYKADVSEGKASFNDVIMPENDTEATITYIENEDYSSSNATFSISIERNVTDNTANTSENDNSTNLTGLNYNFHPTGGVIIGKASFESAELIQDPAISNDRHRTGNPILMVLLALLIGATCFKCRK